MTRTNLNAEMSMGRGAWLDHASPSAGPAIVSASAGSSQGSVAAGPVQPRTTA